MPEKRYPLFDAHAHLISDDLQRYPRNPILFDDAANLPPDVPFGPGTIGIPGGMHGSSPINEKPNAEWLNRWMAEENVIGVAAVQKGAIYRTDNSYIVDAADDHPNIMRAVVIVDPPAPETPRLVRSLSTRNVVGIRFFGLDVKDKKGWLTSPASIEVWDLAKELDLVVDLEAPAFGGELDALIPVVVQMANRHPRLPIVLDHIFLPEVCAPDFGIDARFEALRMCDNIFVKWTSINMDLARENGVAPEAVLRRAVDFFGAERVMWGSDIGTSSGSYKEMVKRAFASTSLLSDAERGSVLLSSGRSVFGTAAQSGRRL